MDKSLKSTWSVPVNQPIIDEAIPCDPRLCVLANATRAALPSEKVANITVENGRVDLDVMRAGRIIEHRSYPINRTIALAVIANDVHGVPLEPFWFRLSKPIVTKPKKKRVRVRPHMRNAPGEGEEPSVKSAQASLAGQRSGQQRHMAAKALKVLREMHGPGARYLGMGAL